jgi:hypothetical protein
MLKFYPYDDLIDGLDSKSLAEKAIEILELRARRLADGIPGAHGGIVFNIPGGQYLPIVLQSSKGKKAVASTREIAEAILTEIWGLDAKKNSNFNEDAERISKVLNKFV